VQLQPLWWPPKLVSRLRLRRRQLLLLLLL
jgi:hypothetical protein